MECPICFTHFPNYVIHCGSDHAVCEQCEVDIRMKDSKHMVKCPICHVTETKSGVRTPKSYEYELEKLYGDDDHWVLMAAGLRTFPAEKQEVYLSKYPKLRDYLPPRQYVQEPCIRPSRRIVPASPSVSTESLRSSRSAMTGSWSSSTDSREYTTPMSSTDSTEYKSIYCQGTCGAFTRHKCSLGCGRSVCEKCVICLFH